MVPIYRIMLLRWIYRLEGGSASDCDLRMRSRRIRMAGRMEMNTIATMTKLKLSRTKGTAEEVA
jgi:hypothetical protein